MHSPLLSAALAFVGYSILNLSQAVQKIGLEMRKGHPKRGTAIWAAAVIASGLSFLIVFGAIAVGSVSVVGAMAGTGLVSVSLFASRFMNERLEMRDTVAMAVIAAGAVLIALFSRPGPTVLRVIPLWVIPAAVTAAAGVAIAAISDGPLRGTLFGTLSGFLGAYSQLFQKVSTNSIDFTAGMLALVRSVVTDPITLVWIGLSAASMVVIQFGYGKARAVDIIPTFTSAFIITPVVGGVIVFGERVTPLQWVGVVVILLGSYRLARK